MVERLYPGITKSRKKCFFQKNPNFEPAQNCQTLNNGGTFNTQN